MPVYQFACENCYHNGDMDTAFPEITMPLADLEKYDANKKGYRDKCSCPKCGEQLRKMMCPPKTIRIN